MNNVNNTFIKMMVSNMEISVRIEEWQGGNMHHTAV